MGVWGAHGVNGHTVASRRWSWAAVINLVVPGFVAAVLALHRSAATPLWRDEYATVMYTHVPLADLWTATQRSDRVLVPYYALMRLLTPLLGHGIGLRAVSIVAFAVTASLIAALAHRWWGRGAALVAGAGVALNPELIGLAVTARPYALSVFFVALALVLLPTPARAGSAPTNYSWIGFAAACLLATLFQPFAIIPIALTVVLRPGVAWLIAATPGAATAVVMLALSAAQSGQVDWLSEPSPRTVVRQIISVAGIAVGGALILDLVAAALLAALGLVALARLKCRSRVMFAGLLTVAPGLALAAESAVSTPLFLARYFAWSALGAALLLAAGWKAGGGHVSAPTVMCLALLAIPTLHTLASLRATPARLDDLPAIVSTLRASASSTDGLALVEPPGRGGLRYAFAAAAGNQELEQTLVNQLREGTYSDVTTGTVTSLLDSGVATGAPRRLWVVSLDPVTGSLLADHVPAECLAGLPQAHVRILTHVRLLEATCSGS